MSVHIFPHKLHGTCKAEVCGTILYMTHLGGYQNYDPYIIIYGP